MERKTTKYYSVVTYVDVDTGEIINRYSAIRSYIIEGKEIEKEYKLINNTQYNGTRIIYKCKFNGQLEMFE